MAPFLLGGILFSSPAGATGLGEIILHSRIGEKLLAEVPLLAPGNAGSDITCFSLENPPGAEFPIISKARLRLMDGGSTPRLLIIGQQAIDEPIFMISLRAGCDMQVQRDYLLMPEGPAEISTRPGSTGRATARPDGKRTPSGAKHPGRKEVAEATPRPRPPAEIQPGDRLQLSSPPADLPRALTELPSPTVNMPETERLLRMETSLRSLTQELDTIQGSLSLSGEMLATRHELQLAQSLLTTPPPSRPPRPAWRNWLALLASAIIGGAVVAGSADWIARRKQRGPA